MICYLHTYIVWALNERKWLMNPQRITLGLFMAYNLIFQHVLLFEQRLFYKDSGKDGISKLYGEKSRVKNGLIAPETKKIPYST